MRAFSRYVISFLEKYVYISNDLRDVYVYGFDLWFYTTISTSALLIVGFITERFIETVILITVFYMNQSIGGGFHAETHLNCFFIMIFGLILYLLSFKMRLPVEVYFLIYAISLLFFICFPLVLHKNKAHLCYKQSTFLMQSYVFVAFESIIYLIVFCFLNNNTIIHAFTFSIILCVISRLLAIIYKLGTVVDLRTVIELYRISH